jgi:hypothetical protein
MRQLQLVIYRFCSSGNRGIEAQEAARKKNLSFGDVSNNLEIS